MSGTDSDGTHVILGPVASKTVQTLVEVYGFELERCVDAVQFLGEDNSADVSLAVDWLLENGEEDKGGAVNFVHCKYLDAVTATATSSGKQKVGGTAASVEPPLIAPSQLAFGLPCARGCASTENWICLQCGLTHCGRYVKKHALAHHNECGHSPAVSVADLSVWCYKSNAYVEHPRLQYRSQWPERCHCCGRPSYLSHLQCRYRLRRYRRLKRRLFPRLLLAGHHSRTPPRGCSS